MFGIFYPLLRFQFVEYEKLSHGSNFAFNRLTVFPDLFLSNTPSLETMYVSVDQHSQLLRLLICFSPPFAVDLWAFSLRILTFLEESDFVDPIYWIFSFFHS
jgi:hypothetical protein